MQASNAKQDAIEAINSLPDNVAFDEIVYQLYVLNKAHQGMQDIAADRVITSDELTKEIEQW